MTTILNHRGLFFTEPRKLFHLKSGITNFTQLVAIMKQIEPRYHDAFLTDLNLDFLKKLLSKSREGLDALAQRLIEATAMIEAADIKLAR